MDAPKITRGSAQLLDESKSEGNELFRRKKYEEALGVYLGAVAKLCGEPLDSTNVRRLVQFFRENGGKKEVDIPEGKSADSPHLNQHVKDLFTKICHNVSLCYYFLDRPEEAIDYSSYVSDMDSKHYKSYHTLGLCYEKLKNYKKCMESFERCKLVLLKEGSNCSSGNSSPLVSADVKNEVNRINEKLKRLIREMEEAKQQKEGLGITIDMAKKTILDDASTEEEKIKMIHSICKHKIHTLLRENIFYFFSQLLNHGENSLSIEKACLHVIYKLVSKMERDTEEISRNTKVCINKVSDMKLEYYYDLHFVKTILSLHESFDEQWINSYVKEKMKKMETLKFDKKKDTYKLVKDILIFIIHIVKYIHVVTNDKIIRIINTYFLSNDDVDIATSALDAIIFLCKKKKFFIQKRNTKEGKNSITLLNTLLEDSNIDVKHYLIDTHFGDICKHPLCANLEIKTTIQQCISMHENFPSDVEYALILILSLLYDKNRPSEKDTEMNDLIYECIDLYFKPQDIGVEWFLSVKCLFLVDKNIVLNYLIGKNQYLYDILTFINQSVGRKPKKDISLFIDVLLLLLNISELRFMLNTYIDVYINILKTFPYDENFLKFLVGSFKLYMHSKEFKEEIVKRVDLFSYAKELLKRFLLRSEGQKNKISSDGGPTQKDSPTSLQKREFLESTEQSSHNGRKNCELVSKMMKKQTKISSNGNTDYDTHALKDLIEMVFYLSLHIEFKKQLLEQDNQYILFFLIKVGDEINQKKLDNTYKYLYCNTINNLILTRKDEQVRRREINKANLSNFDSEQIEALEQFYEKLPTAAKPKTDPLYDYGDEDTSNQLIKLLMYNENYVLKVKENADEEIILPKGGKYKNGAIVNTIYNFINTNFFTINIAEAVCDIICKFVKDTKNIGLVLVNNGLKALLLASKHIANRKNCALALSEIFIYTNPKLVHFYEAYDSLPLLIQQLDIEEELLVFKSLMAITNILTIDENVAIKAMQLNLWNKCFDILVSENVSIRSASLECICNLCSQPYVHQYVYDKYKKIAGGNGKDEQINFVDIQIMFSFTMEKENYKAVYAATGALGMLSSDLRLPVFLIRTKGFHHVFNALKETDDEQILLRILTFFNNVILGENVPSDDVKRVRDAVRDKTGLDGENAQIAQFILQ
ncbi:conserved Plasmodium protein, unknown function [Plasmodium knowlesi strain H]|uniref:Tetratricopeptide repeat family protein n=3 Tax=Plasmodium knowlesi TaxID=5850 RepID=A0A5K1U954_PLAKH|nr:myosin-specific chaperone UNC, putative [Plasmodium knowlesi strain H]OTN67634.1 Uncharacterized protein PKNOH_S05381700 [Plasmodium knowlesi]CAA9990408.1 myosin-specific chaperone UNC, putative [Plasmodium knowlesi strain H]SBO19614.1 conserved Plasmodium protein, unknown function [Plasmodium knowlesi strain H]SBO22600.1 conserved Plasmodium protein, unknown function [Plasmodium knowlesi strain H]VVS79882.1 myosin-specific chaperone UNC, putative [Plasmodium knowlesi strain H]|eukprot:XP_002260808.1 hypothetical protein, conserved in Plasmodium species [Plasmodium knowlesi strain H]